MENLEAVEEISEGLTSMQRMPQYRKEQVDRQPCYIALLPPPPPHRLRVCQRVVAVVPLLEGEEEQGQMEGEGHSSKKKCQLRNVEYKDNTDTHGAVGCILSLSLMEFHLLLLNHNLDFGVLLSYDEE